MAKDLKIERKPGAFGMRSECFSIFPCGYLDRNDHRAKPQQRPSQVQGIGWVYEYIVSGRARRATEELRSLPSSASRQARQDFKLLNFEYATFSGEFSYRTASSLVVRSPFLTLDIDHLGSMVEARELQRELCCDVMVETDLCFVSPSGNGVKWVVTLPEWTDDMLFRDQFEVMRRYVGFAYGVDPDRSGSDVCRACFLPYDPECFVNSRFISNCF